MINKQDLDMKQLAILSSEMDKNKKSTGVAYLLLLFAGSLGAHKFYLKHNGWGATYLILTIVGAATLFIGIGIIPLAFVGIRLIWDLFTIPEQVQRYNEDLENQLIFRLWR